MGRIIPTTQTGKRWNAGRLLTHRRYGRRRADRMIPQAYTASNRRPFHRSVGRPFLFSLERRWLMGRVVYRRYGLGDDPAAGAVVEIQQPDRSPEIGADFGVPLGQAVVTGLFAGTGITALLVWLGNGRVALWPAWGVAVAVCMMLAWFWRLSAASETLWRVEQVTGLDDRPPDQAPAGHILALNPYQGRQAQQRDQAAELRGLFARFVLGCVHDTSARRWESKLGRERYQVWRELLIRSGYAIWRGRNPRDGWRLTAAPADVIRALQDQAADRARRPAEDDAQVPALRVVR